MALSLKDRVKELTTTTGTGTLTLVSAPTGFRRFSSALSDGDSTYYTIESGANWEVGVGVYSANTLTRATVLASSNSNALINITAARSFVFIVYPADKATYKDGSGRIVSGAAGIIFSDNSVQTTAATTPDLSAYATLASPTFTGVPAAPTAAGGTNTTQIATTAFVTSAVGSIDLSPYLTISSAASTYLTQSSATTLLAAKADLVGGLIPSAQLPSYVDDVVEAANLAAFPGTGETGKIYVAIDTGYTYRWSGSVYVRINEVDLSSYLTSSTAASTYLPLAGGTLTGDLKFTDATYDIGKSGATRPRHAYLSGNIVADKIALGGTATTGYLNLPQFQWIYWGGSPYIKGGDSYDGTPFVSLNNGYGLNGISILMPYNNLLKLRSGAYAQTVQVYETWTSDTSFGAFQIKANAGAAYQIGSAVGSAGGTNRDIDFGSWNSAGTFTKAFSSSGGYLTCSKGYINSVNVGNNSGYSGNYAVTIGDPAYGIANGVTIGPNADSSAGAGVVIGSHACYQSGGSSNVVIGYLAGHQQGSFSDCFVSSVTDVYFGGRRKMTLPATVTIHGTDARETYATNIAGGGLTLAGGIGTGTGVGGSVKIQVAPAGSSGASLNALVDVITVDSTKLSTFAGPITLTQPVSTTGSPTALTITDAAHTTMTASTEATSVNFNLSSTKQFATGALTTQRAMRIQAPTYSFVGASTITTASTLSISGAPVAGTNATITNAYALNVESGASKLGSVGVVLDYAYSAYTWNDFGLIFEKRLSATPGYPTTNSYFAYGATGDANRGSGLWLSATATDPHFGWVENGGSFQTLTRICRDANYVVALRNSTNPFTFRVYNTYTSATSGEMGELRWASNVLYIGSNKGSAGGSARDIAITHGGTVVANFLADRFYLGPIADSTATGGNTRGQYAVDLQINRSAATQVASGAYSICIGITNTASNTSSVAVGNDCTASGLNSQAIGNAASATASYALSIGRNVLASGTASTAIGSYNTASGNYSTAFGSQAASDRYGQFSHCANIFAGQGDAQFVRFILRSKTTDATPTTLMLDGSSARLTIPSGKTMSCKVTVKGIKSDGSAKARFVRLVEITNVGGTTALDTAVEALGTDYNPSGCVCTITADNANDALDISVTGIAAETWRWVCVVEGLEIAYGL